MNFMASRRGFYEDNSKGWTENNEEQEDENGLRCYLGGASAASDQPEMMMDSSSPTGGGGGGGGEESSDGLPPGGGIGLGLGRNSGNNEVQVIEREHMFDKVVTPSDVGKLNRLVIPKQHAERYFPLDSSTNEKGLLLNFEDRNGKPWRFRYSYWNSSQSYVMTKGWSRFVKEKKLDAGDIVSFQRGVGELGKDRLFIDWRRRPDAPELLPPPTIPGFSFSNHFSFRQGNYNHNPPHPYLLPPQQQRQLQFLQQTNPQSQINHHGYAYGSNSNLYGSGSVFYLKSPSTGGQPPPPPPYQQVGMVQMRGGGGSGGGGNGRGGGGYGVEGMPIHHHHHHHHPMVFESVPVVQGKAAAKRLRLFGVNMECPISESDECDILSSTTVPQNSHLSSSSFPSQLPLRSYNNGEDNVINKGKSSMSLDLDI